jgi:hypothetical protein
MQHIRIINIAFNLTDRDGPLPSCPLRSGCPRLWEAADQSPDGEAWDEQVPLCGGAVTAGCYGDVWSDVLEQILVVMNTKQSYEARRLTQASQTCSSKFHSCPFSLMVEICCFLLVLLVEIDYPLAPFWTFLDISRHVKHLLKFVHLRDQKISIQFHGIISNIDIPVDNPVILISSNQFTVLPFTTNIKFIHRNFSTKTC